MDSVIKLVPNTYLAKEIGWVSRSCGEVVLTCIPPLIKYMDSESDKEVQLDNDTHVFLWH